MAKDESVTRPAEGEETKRQTMLVGLSALFAKFSGFGKPPAGTYRVYRRMRANPTIALARAISTAPIKTAMWSLSADDDVPDDDKEFVETQVTRLWPDLIRAILFSLDYGWAPFEKVWEINNDGKLVYNKLKHLLVDKTVILIDKETGSFAGVRQGAVKLLPEKCFVFSYDAEAGDTYGRSRHENIRSSAYAQWLEVSERRGQYTKKTAGIIPIIQYPEGESKDKEGSVQSNFDLACSILTQLGSGHGVAMPNTLTKWAGDLARSGVDLSQLKSWVISFLESKGTHGKEFTNTLRHLESLLMRGWLVPERAAIEGQYGTKAESETQGELALVIADLLFLDILRAINSDIINPLLIYNFGIEARDKIKIERGGIDPHLKMFYREIIKKVLGETANIDLFLTWLDIDAILDNVGLPKSAETVPTERTAPATPEEKKASRFQMEVQMRQLYAKLQAALDA